MNKGNLSRRGFLARSLAGLTVGAGLPLWYANEILAQAPAAPPAPGPNGRINLAVIGTGTNRFQRTGNQRLKGARGFDDLVEAMRQPGVHIATICDVDRENGEFARDHVRTAERGGNRECTLMNDFREVLRRPDIDAVIVGTPDHWHTLIAIAALKAGKAVYCEKPLTLTVDEGKVLSRVAHDTNRTLQTGTQQRSDPRIRLACELVRNNRIGHVRKITALIFPNPLGGPFPVEQPPEGLNWDFWLGPTPQVGFIKERCHNHFRNWYEYSGGKMTDWGAHHNDLAQWTLGMDHSGPTSIHAGHCTQPRGEPNCYNVHPIYEAIYTYANGTQLDTRCTTPEGTWPRNGERPIDNGVLFEGEEGKWIFVNRDMIRASSRALLDDPLPQTAVRLTVSNNHMANFLDAARNRRQPICSADVGHRSACVCHLGNIAIRLGRGPDHPLRWNPQEERFTGDEEANRMLSRPFRAPWRLEA